MKISDNQSAAFSIFCGFKNHVILFLYTLNNFNIVEFQNSQTDRLVAFLEYYPNLFLTVSRTVVGFSIAISRLKRFDHFKMWLVERQRKNINYKISNIIFYSVSLFDKIYPRKIFQHIRKCNFYNKNFKSCGISCIQNLFIFFKYRKFFHYRILD